MYASSLCKFISQCRLQPMKSESQPLGRTSEWVPVALPQTEPREKPFQHQVSRILCRRHSGEAANRTLKPECLCPSKGGTQWPPLGEGWAAVTHPHYTQSPRPGPFSNLPSTAVQNEMSPILKEFYQSEIRMTYSQCIFLVLMPQDKKAWVNQVKILNKTGQAGLMVN